MLVCGLLVLAACGRGRDWRQTAQPAAAVDSDAGYAVPPLVLSAERTGDGAVLLSGRAEPNSRVRLQSPEGDAYGGTVGAGGDWSMPAPTPGGPRLYALGEDLGGRIVRGEGYVVALPKSGLPAALLRAGVGALALDGPATALRIGAVDYDAGGWAIVSGLARPATAVRLQVDGGAPVEGNFNTYRMARMADTPPRIDVHLVPSGGPKWGGVGEPGLGPLAPALANAVFAATGQRVRRLPLKHADLRWT